MKPPRVAASPANLECRLLRIVEIAPEQPGDTSSNVVFGRVIGLHIRDEYLTAAGRFDTIKAQPLTRLGGIQYAPPGDDIRNAGAIPARRRVISLVGTAMLDKVSHLKRDADLVLLNEDGPHTRHCVVAQNFAIDWFQADAGSTLGFASGEETMVLMFDAAGEHLRLRPRCERAAAQRQCGAGGEL